MLSKTASTDNSEESISITWTKKQPLTELQ